MEVHGSPRANLEVKAGEAGAGFRWGEVLERGGAESGPVRVQVVDGEGRQWVHVRVVDADTGDPVGCRVHFRSKEGVYLAPHGHQADVNIAWFEDMGGDCKTGGTPYAYIDGTCQIELPVGASFVEVARGFEYEPTRRQLEIKPGQRHLTLPVKRAFDMKAEGFFSGDTHVHFLSSQSSVLEAEGEDLNVVHLLASQWGRLFTSWEEFTGGVAPTSTENHLVYVSQENRQHVLGHISLLGLRELVAPMCTGGPQEDWIGGEIQALMADWAEECRAQGGLVIMPHMPVPDFENAANIVLGQADAAEMCWVWEGEEIGQGERGYYRWLNVGQKLPIVGGTDKMSNGRILGGSRTYARIPEGREFTFDNWCRAVRSGPDLRQHRRHDRPARRRRAHGRPVGPARQRRDRGGGRPGLERLAPDGGATRRQRRPPGAGDGRRRGALGHAPDGDRVRGTLLDRGALLGAVRHRRRPGDGPLVAGLRRRRPEGRLRGGRRRVPAHPHGGRHRLGRAHRRLQRRGGAGAADRPLRRGPGRVDEARLRPVEAAPPGAQSSSVTDWIIAWM